MRNLILMLMALFFSMLNCKKEKDDEELSIKRTPYTGNELRIDGYYYNKYTVYSENDHISLYFFYENGILLYGSSMPVINLNDKETNYSNGEYYNIIKNKKECWGAFTIIGNKILFERWYSPYQLAPLATITYTGDILNDTTFVITESYVIDNGNKTNIKNLNETYSFKKFSIKPDSVNNFIK